MNPRDFSFIAIFFFLNMSSAFAHVQYFFHWGSSESNTQILEQAKLQNGQGRLTPELFHLIDRWYFEAHSVDRAGPGFYMAEEPLSSRSYGNIGI